MSHFINPEQIDLVKDCFTDDKSSDSHSYKKSRTGRRYFQSKPAKVILNTDGDAIYFSRAAIPFLRDAEKNEWAGKHVYYKHIGTLCLQN